MSSSLCKSEVVLYSVDKVRTSEHMPIFRAGVLSSFMPRNIGRPPSILAQACRRPTKLKYMPYCYPSLQDISWYRF